MMNKIFRLYILLVLFSATGVLAFADEPSSAFDDKFSIDTAVILREQAILKRNQEREERAREYYEKGVELTNAGKLDEARGYFEKAILIIKHPEMAGYINESQRQLKKQETSAVQQQAIEIEPQQKEAEAARQQQEGLQEQRAARQHELEVKALQHKKDLEDQAQFLYQAAVNFFNNKAMDEALEKFNDIENTYPDFKSTRAYIARIKQWQSDEQQRQVEEQKRQQQQEQVRQRRQFELEVNRMYIAALKLYRAHDFEASKKEFLKVNKKVPGYEFTQKYLSKIDHELALKPTIVVSPAPVPVKVTPAPVAKEAQAGDLRQKELAYERRRIQERKDQTDQAQKIYTLALQSYRDRHWEVSKAQFESVRKIIPDFKHTRRYLQKLEIFISAARLKQLRDKENTDRLRRARREREEQHGIELQRRVSSKELADETAKQKDRQERERQRQKKLTEELERQKRLYENDRLLGSRKEETMKAPQESKKANPQRRLVASAPGDVEERQALAQLEARREAIHKQLGDGLEAMYQEALSFYKRGDYMVAADKFKDVRDIIPGYKRSEQYMDEARQKSLVVNLQAVNAPPNASAVPASPSASRQDVVSKVLDLFDLNTK